MGVAVKFFLLIELVLLLAVVVEIALLSHCHAPPFGLILLFELVNHVIAQTSQ